MLGAYGPQRVNDNYIHKKTDFFTEIKLYSQKTANSRFRSSIGRLGVTQLRHLELAGKPNIDFLLVKLKLRHYEQKPAEAGVS